MTRDELADLVRYSMKAAMYGKPGSVLFSGVATIRPSRFYVMGLNPGGDSKVLNDRIIDTLAPEEGTSPYTHECWNKACGDNCVHVQRAQLAGGRLAEADLVRHQRNVICLARLLGHDTPAELPSANAIFARSRKAASLLGESGLSAWDWWKACWPVHQYLLNSVQPEVIITFGYGEKTSPFGFLARQLSAAPFPIDGANPRAGWMFDARVPLLASALPVRVIGIPHPSWNPPRPEAFKPLAIAPRKIDVLKL